MTRELKAPMIFPRDIWLEILSWCTPAAAAAILRTCVAMRALEGHLLQNRAVETYYHTSLLTMPPRRAPTGALSATIVRMVISPGNITDMTLPNLRELTILAATSADFRALRAALPPYDARAAIRSAKVITLDVKGCMYRVRGSGMDIVAHICTPCIDSLTIHCYVKTIRPHNSVTRINTRLGYSMNMGTSSSPSYILDNGAIEELRVRTDWQSVAFLGKWATLRLFSGPMTALQSFGRLSGDVVVTCTNKKCYRRDLDDLYKNTGAIVSNPIEVIED